MVLQNKKIVYYTVVFLFIANYISCNSNEDQSNGELEPRDKIEDLYDRWIKSINAEIAQNRSWVFGDKELTEELSKHLPDNLSFFEDKLKSEFYVVHIFENSALALPQDYSSLKSLQERQRAWLDLISLNHQKKVLRDSSDSIRRPAF